MKRLLKTLIVLLLISSFVFVVMAAEENYFVQRKEAAHNLANAARIMGYPEEHDIIVLAQYEWSLAHVAEQKMLEQAKWERAESEYPVATRVWRFLEEKGYNPYVRAGIIGNMMTEAGGQTLNLHVRAYNVQGFYGLCQWNMAYGKVWWTDLEEQLNFLEDSIEYEFNTFGGCYKNNFNYESFKNIENE